MAPRSRNTAAHAAGAAAAEGAGPRVQGTTPQDVPGFDFAVNRVKLSRAVADVRRVEPSLKGAELTEAVKARYVALGGLLVGDKPEKE